MHSEDWNDDPDFDEFTSAPTLCHLQKWVEETTNYVVDISFDHDAQDFHYDIYEHKQRGCCDDYYEVISSSKNGFKIRSEALEAALFETLNLIS